MSSPPSKSSKPVTMEVGEVLSRVTGDWGLEALAIDYSSQSLNPLFPFHTFVLASAPCRLRVNCKSTVRIALAILFLALSHSINAFPGIAVSLHAIKASSFGERDGAERVTESEGLYFQHSPIVLIW